jgi:hypothetical protein
MPPEFSIRSDSVDVEQIMKQIRERIREKRGVDYTEEEVRELASVKLEKFLDPARLRSELLQQYRERQAAPRPVVIEASPPAAVILPPVEVPGAIENYAFEGTTPYLSSRGLPGWLLYRVRRLLNPILKLFINPNPIVHVIAMQSAINTRMTMRIDQLVEHVHRLTLHMNPWLEWLNDEHRRTVERDRARERSRLEVEDLNYELAHNLVLELTRLSMDVKNMKMRVESISSRLDFAERRTRALEGVVQYRPGTGPHAETVRAAAQPAAPAPAGPAPSSPDAGLQAKGDAQRRRRRRRRGRGGAGQGPGQPAPGGPSEAAAADAGEATEPGRLFDGAADAGGGPEPGDRSSSGGQDAPGSDDHHDPDPSS